MNAMHSTTSDKTRARLLALAMHAVFILLIVFGVSWQKKPPSPVEADLWSNLPPMPQMKVEAKPDPEPEPQPKPAPRIEPPPAPKMVQVPLKPDIAIKKVEKEKPVPPKVTPKPEVRDEPKADPRKRAEDTTRLEREQEAQRELAAKEAKAAADNAAAERAARAAAARETQRYIGGIYTKVWARVRVPTDMQGNPEAEVMVSLLPGGELESVTLRKSSGNAAYDAAILEAIRQAQPFVVPTGDEFHRNFRRFPMAFRPRQ